jgi:hypothetical protein
LQRFVGIVWDGPEPGPAGAGADGRNARQTNAKSGARAESGTVNPQMIYLSVNYLVGPATTVAGRVRPEARFTRTESDADAMGGERIR